MKLIASMLFFFILMFPASAMAARPDLCPNLPGNQTGKDVVELNGQLYVFWNGGYYEITIDGNSTLCI
jgi:hypothetical protein